LCYNIIRRAAEAMQFWFNSLGVVIFSAILIAVPIILITRDMIRQTFRIWKLAVYLAGYLLLQVPLISFLMNDFAKPSIVDLSVLSEIGDNRIEGFEERHAVLRESSSHIRTVRSISTLRYFLEGMTIHVTIHQFDTPEAAYYNLMVAAGIDPDEIIQITETVYGYPAPSVMWRDRHSNMNAELHREQWTYFVVGEILFILREVGDRNRIGEGANATIARLLHVYFH
jgi:hypothetical protein